MNPPAAPDLAYVDSWPPVGTRCCLCGGRYLGRMNGRPWRAVQVDLLGIACVAQVCPAEFPADHAAAPARRAHLRERLVAANWPCPIIAAPPNNHGGFHG